MAILTNQDLRSLYYTPKYRYSKRINWLLCLDVCDKDLGDDGGGWGDQTLLLLELTWGLDACVAVPSTCFVCLLRHDGGHR